MTEIPVPPDELHDWFGVVEDLVGCVLDMALELRKDVEFKGLDRWVFRNCVRRYYEDLERFEGDGRVKFVEKRKNRNFNSIFYE